MKLLTAVAATALSLAFGANAFAQSDPSALTHAEVIAQLQQAQAEGLVPSPKNDYPPSATTIARNRRTYAIQHSTDRAHKVNTAGMPAAHPVPASN
ncbi:DUF4148 domain-containing protein [Paraburkholderia sp. FT54]|uniref:DUF4148 domain-containing protein n=1 Tax=Paraburkholderia sp. FT54 TaxID=3074437 RepID=UPI002877440B|nr:DUF4148 domain-containing protein [Paraburkholderia sp. FT54]WNC94931.1 DUF4148 domain-containing protein [Paraburkholderia sp. FT54]